MNDCSKDLNQTDEGDLLRGEVSYEAVEAAASVATGGLPTFWYSTHCFGCPCRPASKDKARRIAANVVKLQSMTWRSRRGCKKSGRFRGCAFCCDAQHR